MDDAVRINSRQLDSLLAARGWSRARLLEKAGIQGDDLERVEARGTAPAALAVALANALDVSPAMFDGDSPQARLGRRRTRYRVAIGLGLVLAVSLWFGYKVGADLAKRDNYRDCVAAGQVDCKRR